MLSWECRIHRVVDPWAERKYPPGVRRPNAAARVTSEKEAAVQNAEAHGFVYAPSESMAPLQQKGSSRKQGRGQLGLRARYWTQGEQKIRKPTFPGQEKREKGECRETGRPRNRVFRLNLFINKFGLFMPPLNR